MKTRFIVVARRHGFRLSYVVIDTAFNGRCGRFSEAALAQARADVLNATARTSAAA